MRYAKKRFKKFIVRAGWWGLFCAVLLAFFFYACPVLRFEGGTTEERQEQPLVLSLWHTDTFEGGRGSRASFLKNVAAAYGKKNKNIVVLVSSYTAEGLAAAFSAGQLPDLLSFAIGSGVDSSLLLPFENSFVSSLKAENSKNGAAQTAILCGAVGELRLALPWCTGAYVLYSKNGEFLKGQTNSSSQENSAGSKKSAAVSFGGRNLAGVAAAFAFPVGEISLQEKSSTAAYADFLNGGNDYLLGTQRDIYRFAVRNATVYAKFSSEYNDLYQYIGVTKNSAAKNKQKAGACADFVRYLFSESVQKSLYKIGMFSPFYRVYEGRENEAGGSLAAAIENEIFSLGGAKRGASVFLSCEARKNAQEAAGSGNFAQLKKYVKEK